MTEAVYAAQPETRVYDRRAGGSMHTINKVLMNTWLGLEERDVIEGADWLRVRAPGRDGWVRLSDTKPGQGLKLFFVDVGQGDGVLMECDGKRYLVDGGPNDSLWRYLTGWQYTWLLNAEPPKPVHIDAIFVTHFDADHYRGLTTIISDARFTVGTIWHNGIARFHKTVAVRPAGFDSDLGRKSEDGDYLITSFDSLGDLRALVVGGGLQATFRRFAEAVIAADDEGRLKPDDGGDPLKRLDIDTPFPIGGPQSKFRMRTLGPIPNMTVDEAAGGPAFAWFGSSSHTRNGHSLVLRIDYGGACALLTGDLNAQSQHHLLAHTPAENHPLFAVNVAKACHHGSSDFSPHFMGVIGAEATIISSGDNESYAHPRADAIGVAGKASRADHPLVFSTELARSVRSGQDVLYGMINARTDGDGWVLAQMKERPSGSDLWDSYIVPYNHPHE